MRRDDAGDFADDSQATPLFLMRTDHNFTQAEISAYYAARVPGLKQRPGRESRGPCPIHRGTNDSFAVNMETGEWFCHSQCNRGGDIFTLEEALVGGDFRLCLAEVYRLVGRPEPGCGPAGTGAGGNGRGKRKERAGDPSRPETKPEDRASCTDPPVIVDKIRKQLTKRGFRAVAEYPYGSDLRKVRFEHKSKRQIEKDRPEKTFRWEHQDDGVWYSGDGGKPKPLYVNSLFHERDQVGLAVGFEGEGKVGAATGIGLAAFSFKDITAEQTLALADCDVVLWPDNDESGRGQAQTAARIIAEAGKAHSLRILTAPSDLPPGGDIIEAVQELGWDGPQVQQILKNATPYIKDAGGLGQQPSGATSSEFRLTDDVVIHVDPDPGKEPLRICGRLEVAALTRGSKGDGWGRLLRWDDAEGHRHQWAMPMSLLAGDGNEYRARLLDGGLFLAPGRKARELLTVYLQTARPDAGALCVDRVGWHGDSFVLPSATIGPTDSETVLFQTPFETEHHLNVHGTVDEWRDKVGKFCSGNSRLILAASCGFAGPLLSLVGAESGGVHIVGTTSTGKSTALLVGGSVLGGGGRNGFVQSWRATANGLEAIAELHNDMTLFLDELAQMDPREAAEVVYLLGNGSGKARMSRNIGSRKKLHWSLLLLSAGELTLADHAQTAGRRTKGGAEVRLLNIEADAGAGLGLFEDIHGSASPDVFARQLKEAASRYYGAPLRAYLKIITGNRAEVESSLRNFQADFLKTRVPAGATGEVLRAAQRFALIAAAGELASRAGITGWAPGEATEAAERCFQSWVDARGTTGSGDVEVAINQVRRFLGVHGASRFQSAKARFDHQGIPIHEKVIDRAGFRVDDSEGEATMYLVLPEVFRREVCEGFDYKVVARALLHRGYLECEPPHLTKKPRLPEVGIVRVYAVKASILGE